MQRIVHIHPWRLLVFGLAAGLLPGLAAAQQVRAYVSRDSVAVGDRFMLTLVAEHAGEAEVLFPAQDEAPFGDLEIIAASPLLSRIGPGAGRQDSIVYNVTTFALDTASVPALPIRFALGGDTADVMTDPLWVPVRSLVPGDSAQLRGLAPLAEFPMPLWPWLLALLAAGGLGYAAYRYLNRRPEPVAVASAPAPPPESPYVVALRRLAELEKTASSGDLKAIKPYYVTLSEILRVYLSRRLRIPAMESTSQELIAMLKRRMDARVIPDTSVSRAQQIFRVMDLVKFADLLPPPHVGQEALTRTRTLIESIEQTMVAAERPPQPAPTPGGQTGPLQEKA